jgi:hypothetical protein
MIQTKQTPLESDALALLKTSYGKRAFAEAGQPSSPERINGK